MSRAGAAVALALAYLLACAGPALAKSSRTPVASRVKKLSMSPQELRIRVRALIRPTIGIVEECADHKLEKASEPAIRRGTIRWKIETTTTFLSTMLRVDPVLALADAWGYAFQVEEFVGRPELAPDLGSYANEVASAMARIRAEFRDLVPTLGPELDPETVEATIKAWADNHPIEGALYRRVPMDAAVADVLAEGTKGGAFDALGSLEETTADVMTRMDLYTMYLPRLARWEAELGVDDLTRGADPKDLIADLERFTHAADRLASVAEGAPGLVERERAATLAAVSAERLAATRDLQGERRVILDAVRQERIAALDEIEAIAQRLIDRSSGPLQEATRQDLTELVQAVESMRKRVIEDTKEELFEVIDHAFVRGIELLGIATVLAVLGAMAYSRLVRRSS